MVAADHSSYRYELRRTPNGDGWVCEFPDLPGCGAIERTQEEAVETAMANLTAWIDKAESLGIAIPEPGTAFKVKDGEIKVRVPKLLHRRLVNFAGHCSYSLNELTVRLLYAELSRVSGDAEIHRIEESAICDGIAAGASSLSSGAINPDRQCSGSWRQRLPRAQHLRLQALASAQGISVNLLVSVLVALALARLETLTEIEPQRTRAA